LSGRVGRGSSPQARTKKKGWPRDQRPARLLARRRSPQCLHHLWHRRAGGEQRRRPHHRRSGSKSTSTIEGFQVTTQTSPVFVIIAITLGPDAMFNLLFNNVSEEEAMTIAQKFDWKGIQQLVN
jgi:hypothetical protein